MSVPLKHHYLPEFLVRRWTDTSRNFVFEYSRPHQEVSVRRRLPAETGFQAGLYSIPTRDQPAAREEIELRFMQQLDNDASLVLEGLERTGEKPSDSVEASAWTRFLMSLVYRTPAEVTRIEEKIRGPEFSWRMEEAYQKIRGEGDPASYEEWSRADEDSVHEAKASLLRRIIDSEFVGQRLNDTPWYVGDVRSGHDLLLADNPVVTSNGVGTERGFLIVPIGPTKFFLATANPQVADTFMQLNEQGRLGAHLNQASVRQADRLLIGATDLHKQFVEERMAFPNTPRRDERLTWEI